MQATGVSNPNPILLLTSGTGTFVPANRFSFSETKGLSFFFTAYSLDKFALK